MTMRIPGPLRPLRFPQTIKDGTLYVGFPEIHRKNRPAQIAPKSRRKIPKLPWYFYAEGWRKKIMSKGKIKKTFEGEESFDVTYYPAKAKVTVDMYISFKFDGVQKEIIGYKPHPVRPDSLPQIPIEGWVEWSKVEESEFKREWFKTIKDVWADSFVVFNKELRLKADVHINLVDLDYPSASRRKNVLAYKYPANEARVWRGTDMHISQDRIAGSGAHEFGHFMSIGDEYPLELKAGDQTKHSWLTEKYLNKVTIVDADPESLMHNRKGGRARKLRARHGVIIAWALHKMTEYNGWSVRLNN